MNHFSKWSFLCLISIFLSSSAWSDDAVRSEKSQFPNTSASHYKKPNPPPEDTKIWEVEGSFGVEHDNNINHLLTNLNLDSNVRTPDTILTSHAMIDLFPHFFNHDLETNFSYSYDRFDFQNTNAFSYFNHGLNMDLYPRLTPTIRLDTGMFFDWTGDSSGYFANDQGGVLGVIWRGPNRIRVKTGYIFQHDGVRVDTTKTSNSNIFYLTGSRIFDKMNSGFVTYRFRNNHAQGPDFSYNSHSLRAGWIAHWLDQFKTTLAAGFMDKPYTNVDDRFLVQRHDKIYSLLVKPTVTLIPGLDVVGSAEYLHDNSNVGIKSYWDQIYSIGLEGRF